MKQHKEGGLDFIIDQLTNSIQNIVTGDSFVTEVSVLTAFGVSGVTKRNGWLFNWRAEIKNPVKEV